MKSVIIWTTLAMCVVGEIAYKGLDRTKSEAHPNQILLNAIPSTNSFNLSKWESVHGFLEVRPGAHLFYWLFYADGTKEKANTKPLIIWIQGGPGLAASGVGNFAEIGPFNMDMQPRNHTWVVGRNVLFIDHPVGVGFSYVTDESLYVKTDKDLALDLARATKLFLRRHKEFQQTPTYLIGQSYGGKACPRLAYYLHTAIENKSLKMNLKGIGIGGGWVSPKESTAMQADYLYHTGILDRKTYLAASKIAKNLIHALKIGDYAEAAVLDAAYFDTLNTDFAPNYNNVYAPSSDAALEELSIKINFYVKQSLQGTNQTNYWTYMSYKVYEYLKDDLLLPSTYFLETLLDQTKLKIAVYNGNLDAVTPLAGASNWVHKLNWRGATEFRKAKRSPIPARPGKMNGFYKESDNFSFWWVFGAGHWIPEENPEAMEYILEHLIGRKRS